MAMPVPEAGVHTDMIGTTWHLWHEPSQTDLSIAANRRAWWSMHHHIPTECILTLADVVAGTVPEPTRQHTRLIITDALIDKLGHDDELEILGNQVARDRYLDGIMRLRNRGW